MQMGAEGSLRGCSRGVFWMMAGRCALVWAAEMRYYEANFI